MDQQQQSRWRPPRRQLLWAGTAVGLLTIAILIGYRYGITLWEWLKLLVVPAVIAGGGIWFNRQQRDREMEIAEQRSQDEAMQAYLDGMSQLLTDEKRPLHRAQLGDSLSTVARARTLTVLGRLDRGRKRSVLQFLYDSGLIYKEQTLLNESYLIERRHNIVSLEYAFLMETKLSGAKLSEAFLSGAFLMDADLSYADLSEAVLSRAFLMDADLSNANLSGADLSWAILRSADLSQANLMGANLTWTLGWTEEQLSKASTLEGATMPDGQILQGDAVPDGPTFEEWLKSKDREENRKNDGSP